MKSFITLGAVALAVFTLSGCGGGWGHTGPYVGTEQPPAASDEGKQQTPLSATSPPTISSYSPELPSRLQNPEDKLPAEPNRPKDQPVPSTREPAAPALSAKEKPDKPAKKERSEKKSVPVQQNRILQKSLTLSQIRQKYDSNFKTHGSSAEKKIALTFDDGPDDKYTAQVLDMLKNYHVKATFFVLGSRAERHPELIARMVREGHIVGNHTYSHANLPKLAVPNFEKQVESTQSVLKSMLGYEPKLFRPPYGAVNEEQARWAADHQLMIVNWNVDSLDWKGLSAEKVENNIVSTTKPGSIILQHCGGGPGEDLSGTVQALPGVIRRLKSQGYQFVTVPELLHVPKSK